MLRLTLVVLGVVLPAPHAGASSCSGQPPPANEGPTVDVILGLLNGDEFKQQRLELIKLGNRAFPAYQIILDDPESDPVHVSRALGVISAVPGERSQFVEPAVRRLSDPEPLVRLSAVNLLGKIGSSREAAPIAVLLSDGYRPTVYAAAIALAAIGDRRTVAAMDVWLKTGNHRDDAELLAHVKKCRDELQRRLEKEQKQKPPGAGADGSPGQPPPVNERLTVDVILGLLNGDEFKEDRQTLVKMGEKVFPLYQVILDDPESEPIHIARIFVVLESVNADRQQFVEPAIRRLTDSNSGVRYQAVRLLARIGSSRDVAPVVALLSDTDPTISYNAATTLAAIGDRRTLAALDVWLKTGNHRDDAELLAHVKKCRDELKQRLDKEEKEKKPGK